MRVLVTGATGFLGSHVVDLLLAGGNTVVAPVRDRARAHALERTGAAVCTASLETGAGLDEALEGVTHVVHCAGGGQVRSFDYETFRTQNVRTTEVLLRHVVARHRARHARDGDPGVLRFVHASSITAAPGGTARADGTGNLGDPAPRSLYGRSKREAEDVVLAAKRELAVTLVRLPALYGPRDERWLTAFRAARLRLLPVLSPHARMSLLYATDAARSLVLPLERHDAHPSGAIYSPDDGTPRTHEELGRLVAKAVGVRAYAVRVPERVLYGAARAAEWLGSRTGGRVFLTRDKARDMLDDVWRCDAGPMRDALGFAPQVSFDEGAEKTAAWFRAQGLL